MRKVWLMLAVLLGGLFLWVGDACAQDIKPVGEKVASDQKGYAIYQIEGNGIKIGYKLRGTGEPLVLIPGQGGTMELWPEKVLSLLSQKYQLILLDNRGMGYSTINDTPFSYPLFANDVIALLDALKVEKANVLGFSMGSMITQALLMEHSSRLMKAVVCSTTMDGAQVATTFTEEELAKFTPTVKRQYEASKLWKTPLDKAALIPNQVLFVIGTVDTRVGIQSSKVLAATVPGAWLVQFKNATHGIILEAQTEFSRIVLTFLDINSTVAVNLKGDKL